MAAKGKVNANDISVGVTVLLTRERDRWAPAQIKRDSVPFRLVGKDAVKMGRRTGRRLTFVACKPEGTEVVLNVSSVQTFIVHVEK